MNYYPHHIGDFIRETSRLNDSQTMAYLRLIWLYYDSETPLENDLELLAFKIGSDVHTVGLLLKCFFYADGMRWHHKRIDDEISAYKSKSEKAKGSAQARWKKPQNMPIESERNANAMRTHTESNANQEPLTKNHSLNTSSPQVATRATANRFEEFWNTYPNTPRRVAKSKCVEKWKALRLDDQAEEIIKHVTAMKATEQWREGFEPAPLTYINQRRWSDGIPEVQNTPQTQAKKPVDLWWTTDHGVIAKGKELGLNPRPGETMGEFKGRINLKMNEVPA